MLFIFLYFCFLHSAYTNDKKEEFFVAHDVPTGWLISNLFYDGLMERSSDVKLEKTNYSEWFSINNDRSLVVFQSLANLKGKSLPLRIKITRQFTGKFIDLTIHIIEWNATRFKSNVYNTSISDKTSNQTEIKFPEDIRLININGRHLYVSILSASSNDAFTVVTREDSQGIRARVFLIRPITPKDEQLFSFYVSAIDKKTWNRIALAQLNIHIEQSPLKPPNFNAEHYYQFVTTIIKPYVTIMQVLARTEKGVVIYRVEPEDELFDVTPFSGEIFSRKKILDGIHEFQIIATDSYGQESQRCVRIEVQDPSDTYTTSKSNSSTALTDILGNFRSRRELGGDIVIRVKENHALGWLKKYIPLFRNEKIIPTPVVNDFVTVFVNGSLKLIKKLNYELMKEIVFSVRINGSRSSKYIEFIM